MRLSRIIALAVTAIASVGATASSQGSNQQQQQEQEQLQQELPQEGNIEYVEPTFEGQETEASLQMHQEELNAAKDLFLSQLAMNNATVYEFYYELSCFCLPADYPWKVTVEVEYDDEDNTTDGAIPLAVGRSRHHNDSVSNTRSSMIVDDVVVSAITTAGEDIVQDSYLNTYSILDLFARIQSAIDQEAHDISVAYNQEWGYPEEISVDYSFMIADEEFYVTVSRFMIVEWSRRTAVISTGESDSDRDEVDMTVSLLQLKFDKAYSLWKSLNADEYYFEYSLSGSDYLQENFPWSAYVQDGMVSSVTDAAGEDVMMLPGADLTIENIFKTVQQGILEHAHYFLVNYDEIHGYPVDVWIVFDPLEADDEVGLSISHFSTIGRT